MLGFLFERPIGLYLGGHQPSVAGSVGLVRLRRPWAADQCRRSAWLSGQADAAMLSGECMHASATLPCAARWLVAGWEPLVARFHCSARVRCGPLLV